MITLKNVSKNVIRDDKEVRVLDNINLQLGDKGIVVLRGGKDAGKTCLLRMIAQLDNISDGNIFVDGVDIGLLSHKEIENYRTHHVGMVMGTEDILPDLTIEENISIGTAFGRIKPKRDVLELLYNSLELRTVTKRKAKECTDSEKVCANIARLMIKSPKVFLIDDFESILEPDTMLRVWRLLKEISENHLVVIVSDSNPYISKFADRVITLNLGKIVSDTGSDTRKESTAQSTIMDKSMFLKKHRFTLDATGKILKQMIFTNGKSMITAMILSLLLVISFFIFSSLSVFNTEYTIAKSSVQHKEEYIEFYKGSNVDTRESLNYDTTKDVSVIAELQSQKLANFCAKHEVNWVTNVSGDGFVISSLITNSQEVGLLEENRFGQRILSGVYTGSGAIANKEEHATNIVISDYMAEVIIRNGIKNGFPANQNAIGHLRNQLLYDSLTKPLNQVKNNLMINGINYAIVGIYETDFDKYVNNDLSVKKEYKDIFEYNLKNVYSVVHVNTNFFTMNPRLASRIEVAGDYIMVNSQTGYKSYSAPASKVNLVNGGTVSMGVFGEGLTKLTDNNVYVSADIMQQILSNGGKSDLTIEEVIDIRNEIFTKYLTSTYRNIQVKFAEFLDTYVIKGVLSNKDITNTIIVAGSDRGDTTYVTKRSKFEYLYIAKNFTTNGVVLPVGVYNTNEIVDVINTMNSNEYKVNTLATEAIMDIADTISSLRIVFIIVSLVMVAVLILIMFNYIKKLYMRNTKMLGLLRSLGCTKFNISITIALIALLSMIVVLILGGLISWLITVIGNAIMAGAYGYSVSIFSLNVVILLVFVLSILIIPCVFAPNVCQEFQSMMPLYMMKYDIIYVKKKKNEEEPDLALSNTKDKEFKMQQDGPELEKKEVNKDQEES